MLFSIDITKNVTCLTIFQCFHIRQWRLDCKTVARYHPSPDFSFKDTRHPQKKHEWVVGGIYFSSWLWSYSIELRSHTTVVLYGRSAVLQAVGRMEDDEDGSFR